MPTDSPRGDEPPPQHVLAAFGLAATGPERLGGGSAWLCEDAVLTPVPDRQHAVWLAGVLARIEAPGLRVARPIRSTDGRTLIGGWQAYRYLGGAVRVRPDELIRTSLRLHEATAPLDDDPPVIGRGDIGAAADRLAWGEEETDLDEHNGGRWFEVLAGARKPVSLPDQLVHGHLCGSVLFDDDGTPGIVDFEPYFRPAEWAAAVVAVDVLAADAADAHLLRRWSHLPEWPQLLLRAILFRLAEHAMYPHPTREILDGLLRAAHEVSEML